MTQSNPPVEALVFDAYGTLYDVASVTALCDRHFPGHGARISEIWRQKQLEYTWLTSLMERYRDFWQITAAGLRHACGALELDLNEDVFREIMENYLELAPYAEVPAALEHLSGKISLAILSNGSPEMLLKVTQHNGFNKFISEVLSVHELSIFKPAPQVYGLAVKKLGIAKENIGFVSSNAWDAAGAKSFGFQVFWINRFNRAPEELDLPPDHEIRTLDQIAPLIF